jgi:hypothetical protein
MKRSASYEDNSSKYLIIVNMSANKLLEYRIGIDDEFDYQLVLNSDLFEYSGFGMVSYPKILKNTNSNNFELLNREIKLDVLAPYGILVLKAINK